MEYTELSLKEVEEKSKILYSKINNSKYNYDLVIFIAKGAFLIGEQLADLNHCPLLEVKATRSGGKIKKILKPFINFVPKKLLIYMRKKEMSSNVHEKNFDRQVSFNENVYKKYKGNRKILLVDDSIDSGNSIIQVKEKLESYFKKSQIKVAVFNVMKKSLIKPDFSLYEDHMIQGPWSSDSKDNKKFVEMYQKWRSVQIEK